MTNRISDYWGDADFEKGIGKYKVVGFPGQLNNKTREWNLTITLPDDRDVKYSYENGEFVPMRQESSGKIAAFGDFVMVIPKKFTITPEERDVALQAIREWEESASQTD